MKLTGLKTESVYRRYAIVSQSDLEEALTPGQFFVRDYLRVPGQIHVCNYIEKLELSSNSATIAVVHCLVRPVEIPDEINQEFEHTQTYFCSILRTPGHRTVGT